MGLLIIFYALMAGLFVAVDLCAGAIAGSKPRPLASLLFSLVWPASFAFMALASAAIIRALRERQTTTGGGSGE